jgi:hypothetical protein
MVFSPPKATLNNFCPPLTIFTTLISTKVCHLKQNYAYKISLFYGKNLDFILGFIDQHCAMLLLLLGSCISLEQEEETKLKIMAGLRVRKIIYSQKFAPLFEWGTDGTKNVGIFSIERFRDTHKYKLPQDKNGQELT